MIDFLVILYVFLFTLDKILQDLVISKYYYDQLVHNVARLLRQFFIRIFFHFFSC